MLFEDASVSFDEMLAYKHSSRMELADRVLDELLAAAGPSESVLVRDAARVLGAWDRQANADSRGAVLFYGWVQAFLGASRGSPFRVAWAMDSAITTPRGLADPAAAVRALAAAAEGTQRMHGALDVPWGDVMRIRYAGRDLPGNGGPGDPFGIFRTAYYAPESDGTFGIVAGDTYYAITEFAEVVRAKVLLAYGNATQPGSRHIGDQLELFAKQQMRDAWLTRADVEAHLGERVVVGGRE
jgi:acyl-homoserine-lactone acylase